MTLKRMDNVLINVQDLEAAKAFFAELGIEDRVRHEADRQDSTLPPGD